MLRQISVFCHWNLLDRKTIQMKWFALAGLMAFLVLPASAADSDIRKDIVGVWELDFTPPDGIRRTPAVIVGWQADRYVAWYMESGFTKKPVETFTNVQLKDDTLVLSIRPQEQYGSVKVTLAATLDSEGVCSGRAEYVSNDGDSGNWTFTGKRVSESDFEEIETWDLCFTSPDDVERTPSVTVATKAGRLYAWYSSEDYELPADEITLSGDQVVMVINTTAPNGEDLRVEFCGSVAGDQVTGQAEYELAGQPGSFAFEGSKQ